MTDSERKQAESMGRKSAKARYRNHDAALARNTNTYFARWVAIKPQQDHKELIALYNSAYQEESSYYVGGAQ